MPSRGGEGIVEILLLPSRYGKPWPDGSIGSNTDLTLCTEKKLMKICLKKTYNTKYYHLET